MKKEVLVLAFAALVLAGCGTTKTLQTATPVGMSTEGIYTSSGKKHVKGQGEEMEYRRSSLCSILVRHPDLKYDSDISAVFKQIPIPDKYNDHNLATREINAAMKNKNKSYKGNKNIEKTINPYIQKNDVAKLLVSKWFDRKSSGAFDMNLIIERGLYDADYFDVQLAEKSVRGQSLLKDAGEDLIGNTFVIFNDITYLDKEVAAQWATVGVILASGIAQASTNVDQLKKSYKDLEKSITDFNKQIGGFRVTVTSYLYRLRWDDETANTFYNQYYTDMANPEKRTAYNSDKSTFHLDYVGSYKVKTGETTISGVKDQHGMIRKVCQRAIDKNIAQLQKEYEEFRVKTPLFSTSPLCAKIGLKEDITPKSKFEVLEEVEDAEGNTHYRRVGVVRPIKGKIWDNRYMAEYEKENKGNTRTYTEFKVVSGKGFCPGMLLRQIN